ncbi:FUSC family protein [Nakamurella sp. YIM 132087]|uniref:FUSC family protein n=1 Tax=Nakamurella alba TaxID=2665158 RepID=A0A7K1FPJ9_9ACTN|nr:FUSC family protein [Nakamurella alba]MTD16072.1 FUSC family protein [Nakamurella alba]
MSLLREFTSVGPHAAAHRVATRVAVSMAVPLVVLVGIGRADLTLYGAFGAFCSLYGRNRPRRARFRTQVAAGIAFVAAVTIGAAVAISPDRQWLVIPVAAVAAAVITALSQRLRWHPPGALFHLFALTACASVPQTLAHLPLALGVAVASAVVALGIGTIGQAPGPAAPAAPGQINAVAAVEAGIVIAVAGLVPTVTGLGHPYWAMVAAAAAIGGAGRTARLVRAGHRVAGTLGGLAIAAIVLLPAPSAPVLLVVAIAAQLGAELFVGRNYGLALLFVTPLALVMLQLAHHVDPLVLLRDRLLETVIGAAIGIAATLLLHRATRRDTQSPKAASTAAANAAMVGNSRS